MLYQAFYYDGWALPTPAYWQMDVIEGDTPEQALVDNLQKIIASIRRMFSLSIEDVSDEDLEESIYVFLEGGRVSVRE